MSMLITISQRDLCVSFGFEPQDYNCQKVITDAYHKNGNGLTCMLQRRARLHMQSHPSLGLEPLRGRGTRRQITYEGGWRV